MNDDVRSLIQEARGKLLQASVLLDRIENESSENDYWEESSDYWEDSGC